ncbi:MAG: Crp/Fnr family transcriptional regulator [Ideonella sp.]
MSVLTWPSQNFLLNAMPQEAVERLCPDLERVPMNASQVLYESGVAIRDVYFPATAIVSMSYSMENGSSAEIALIGREGMVGLPLLFGTTHSTVQATVQSAGLGFKLPGRSLINEFERGGKLMQVLLSYAGSLIEQMQQTAACNRHATLEQRLCRWLLLTLDRLPGNELTMTHESIAVTLGVKREGVTEVASRLRHEGAIHYRRGHIEVLDRPIIERHACECYRMTRLDPAHQVRPSVA